MDFSEKFSDLAKQAGIEHTYIICSNYRSGSTLLSLGLANTEVAGSPNEYFTFANHQDKIQDLDSFAEHLESLYKTKKSENGVFGFKLMHPDFKWLLKTFEKSGVDISNPKGVLEAVFPDLKYLYIYRKDRLRQAISMVRSSQSKVWHIAPGSDKKQVHADLHYDDEKITNDLVIGVIQAELNWSQFFHSNQIDPMVIAYEPFTEAYEVTMREVVAFLDLPDKDRAKYPEPPLKKIADDLTDEWVDLYLKKNPWLGDGFVRNQLYEYNNFALALYAYLNQFKDIEMRKKVLVSLQIMNEDPSIIYDSAVIPNFLGKLKRRFKK